MIKTNSKLEEVKIEKRIHDMKFKSGANGNNVIDLILKMSKREGFHLIITGKGFHVCMEHKDDYIRLVQLWVDLDQKNGQIIETRRQYLPGDVQFKQKENEFIEEAFIAANFRKIDSPSKNFTLNFGEDVNLRFGGNDLSEIDDAIVRLANIIKTKISEV
jgi:hypothetical protein